MFFHLSSTLYTARHCARRSNNRVVSRKQYQSCLGNGTSRIEIRLRLRRRFIPMNAHSNAPRKMQTDAAIRPTSTVYATIYDPTRTRNKNINIDL